MWNRIALGFAGLLITFSAGEQLQLWWDKGEVRQYLKGGRSLLVNYDLQPITYNALVLTFALGLVAGLCIVWVALGGKQPWTR
jgi:hypothetical protein